MVAAASETTKYVSYSNSQGDDNDQGGKPAPGKPAPGGQGDQGDQGGKPAPGGQGDQGGKPGEGHQGDQDDQGKGPEGDGYVKPVHPGPEPIEPLTPGVEPVQPPTGGFQLPAKPGPELVEIEVLGPEPIEPGDGEGEGLEGSSPQGDDQDHGYGVMGMPDTGRPPTALPVPNPEVAGPQPLYMEEGYSKTNEAAEASAEAVAISDSVIDPGAGAPQGTLAYTGSVTANFWLVAIGLLFIGIALVARRYRRPIEDTATVTVKI